MDPERIPTVSRCESEERTGQVSHRVLNVRPCLVESTHCVGTRSSVGLLRVLDGVSRVATMGWTSVQVTRASACRTRQGSVWFLPFGFAPILHQAETRHAYTSQHHVLVVDAPLQESVPFSRRGVRFAALGFATQIWTSVVQARPWSRRACALLQRHAPRRWRHAADARSRCSTWTARSRSRGRCALARRFEAHVPRTRLTLRRRQMPALWRSCRSCERHVHADRRTCVVETCC